LCETETEARETILTIWLPMALFIPASDTWGEKDFWRVFYRWWKLWIWNISKGWEWLKMEANFELQIN
jgi:hypothetical protein